MFGWGRGSSTFRLGGIASRVGSARFGFPWRHHLIFASERKKKTVTYLTYLIEQHRPHVHVHAVKCTCTCRYVCTSKSIVHLYSYVSGWLLDKQMASDEGKKNNTCGSFESIQVIHVQLHTHTQNQQMFTVVQAVHTRLACLCMNSHSAFQVLVLLPYPSLAIASLANSGNGGSE